LTLLKLFVFVELIYVVSGWSGFPGPWPGYFFSMKAKKTSALSSSRKVVEMNIIKVALSHFCCRTTVQSRLSQC